MYTVLLVIHTIIILFLIGVILIQRPESDGLGSLGGGGGGGGNLFSGRASANLLTRTTAILATLFIVSSMVLAYLSGDQRSGSIVDNIPVTQGAGEMDINRSSPPPEEVLEEKETQEMPATAPAVPKPE